MERPVQPKDFVSVPRVSISAGPQPNPRFAMKHREHKRYGEHHYGQMLNLSMDQTERKARKRRSVDKVGATLVRVVRYTSWLFFSLSAPLQP